MKKTRILFVTPVVPLPPTGGGTRSFHILKALSENGEVDLICFQSLTDAEINQLSTICQTVISDLAKQANSKPAFIRKIVNRLLLLFPFLYTAKALHDITAYIVYEKNRWLPFVRHFLFQWLFFWLRLKENVPSVIVHLDNKELFFTKAIRKLPLQNYQVLVCDLSYLFPYFQKISGASFPKTIINTHNAEFELIQQSADQATDSIEKKWGGWQSLLMKETEKKSIAHASAVFCCSLPDRDKFLQLYPQANLYIIPNGVDISFFQPSVQPDAGLSLLFTGTMNYFPNTDAVSWFAKEVVAPLQKMYPALRFIVAGRKADQLHVEDLKVLVELVSDPEDMRPYFEQATIVVVPLKHGSGTRLKILEAAAMQKPVVSTRLGAEGLEGLTSDMIRLADSPTEFIQSIRELIENPLLRNKLASAIHEWAVTHYSWQGIREQVKEVLSEKS